MTRQAHQIETVWDNEEVHGVLCLAPLDSLSVSAPLGICSEVADYFKRSKGEG